MVAVAVAARVNVQMVVAMAVALVAATVVVPHATTIAMANSSPHAHKAHVHHKAKAVDAVLVDRAWANPLVLRMSHALRAHQQASQTPCVPAWI